MPFIAAYFIILFGAFYFLYLRNVSSFSPVLAFFLISYLTISGVLSMVDLDNPSDQIHVTALGLGMLAFVLGCMLAKQVAPSRHCRRREAIINFRPNTAERLFLKLLFLISISATLVYFYLVGSHFLLEAIFSGVAIDDPNGLRLSFYAGEEYYAPGYFKQFKDTLLPLLFVYFFLTWAIGKDKKAINAVLLLIVAPIVLFGMLGTGQRAPIVYFAIKIAYIYLILNPKNFRLSRIRRIPWYLWFLGICVLGLFILLTIVLGRGESPLDAIGHLVKRIFAVNQWASIVGFRHIIENPEGIGQQWFADVRSVLPGYKPHGIDREIFAQLWGGSTRGNAPLSIFGSVYYNFGLIGIPIFFFAYGVLLHSLHILINRNRQSLIQVVIAAYLIVLFGFWRSGSPLVLLVNGLPALIFAWISIRLLRGRTSVVRGERVRTFAGA